MSMWTPSRRLIIAGLLAGVADGALARTLDRSLRPKARPGGGSSAATSNGQRPKARQPEQTPQQLIAQAKLGGQVGCVVADLRTGQLLESVNGARPLPPASVAKALTAMYAINALGSDFRFETKVVATGGLSNGVVKGDLILVGSGEPTLDTDQLADLAARVKAAGVREVRGKLRANSEALPYIRTIDPDQPDHVGYSPSVSALNLNFNRVHFEWRRSGNGYSVQMDARSEKYRPRVSVAKMEIAARKTPIYTYRQAGGIDQWTVARSALGKGGARWLPTRQPVDYCMEVFQDFLRSNGIACKLGKPANSAKGQTVARRRSPELRVLAREMLKWSTNLTAESLGLTATAKRGRKPGSLKASARAMNSWIEKAGGTRQIDLVDHSGLGDASRISPNDMVKALVTLGPPLGLPSILKEIPMRNSDGKKIASPIKIYAKTGTLNFVSGLAGYIRTPGGRDLAFAMFMADTKRRRGIPKSERERPAGGAAWNKRAKNLQLRLIERWARQYQSA